MSSHLDAKNKFVPVFIAAAIGAVFLSIVVFLLLFSQEDRVRTYLDNPPADVSITKIKLVEAWQSDGYTWESSDPGFLSQLHSDISLLNPYAQHGWTFTNGYRPTHADIFIEYSDGNIFESMARIYVLPQGTFLIIQVPDEGWMEGEFWGEYTERAVELDRFCSPEQLAQIQTGWNSPPSVAR